MIHKTESNQFIQVDNYCLSCLVETTGLVDGDVSAAQFRGFVRVRVYSTGAARSKPWTSGKTKLINK